MCIPPMNVLWLKSYSWTYAPAPLGGGRLFLWGADMTRRCVSARLYFRLFPLFCALFFPLAFSFAISITFPVFGAPRRPVNRLYFFTTGFHSKRTRERGFPALKGEGRRREHSERRRGGVAV